jgi:teichuronic acid biosynthesis glycosyltransferase TuaG
LNSIPADLVSIITPAYNAGRFIADAVATVRAQTHVNWELLIVDDCSSDDTVQRAQRAAASDSRVELIRQQRNSGPACARNAALSAARGRWIAFLDADDYWLPEKLERQLAFHQASGAKITFTEFRRVTEDGSAVGRHVRVPDRLSYHALLRNTAIATSAVLVDRNRTGSFRMKETYYDDYACWLELLRPGGCALGLHQDLMRYRVRRASVSRDKAHSARKVWHIYRQIEGLNLATSAWCFMHYAVRGLIKYRQF